MNIVVLARALVLRDAWGCLDTQVVKDPRKRSDTEMQSGNAQQPGPCTRQCGLSPRLTAGELSLPHPLAPAPSPGAPPTPG